MGSQMEVGETVLSGAMHPGTRLEVLESPAGFYLGYKSATGEPYSRESSYFAVEDQARAFLALLRANPY